MNITSNNQKLADYENTILIMQIMRTRNIGSITFQKLYQKYKEPERILREVKRILSQKGNDNFCPDIKLVEEEYIKTIDYGGNIISIFDEKYPDMLRQCEDPPIIISYIGEIEKVTDNNIGFVGARNCSANGIALAYKYANELADDNYTIISGLAKGIDAASHKGALDSEKYDDDTIPTIGVIGGGVNNVYPKENKNIFEKVARDGVIISEFPLGTSPKAENFPKRNRIISALSKAVLIVEATLRSGSLITARTALEQNREVMCIPGFPLDERAKGCNKLIKEGANIITSINDIKEIMKINQNLKVSMTLEQTSLLEESNDDIFEIDVEEVTEREEPRNNKSPNLMSEDSEVLDIMDYISHTPIEIDELIRISNQTASSINSYILENEIEGKITRHPGNKISKTV